MKKISPFLWFDNNGEEAINFYLSIFKNAKTLNITRTPPDGPGSEGAFLVGSVELEGQELVFMNGGPGHPQTDAFSLVINCESQKEVDYYWEKLLDGGGKEVACGWLTDKFGLSWQVTPIVLLDLLKDPDRAKAGRVMQAMMKMIKLDIATLEAAAAGK
jgi:predicted 3-demethylubiquinone-9 3-methyltransferase (glyoxalase superfamily)